MRRHQDGYLEECGSEAHSWCDRIDEWWIGFLGFQAVRKCDAFVLRAVDKKVHQRLKEIESCLERIRWMESNRCDAAWAERCNCKVHGNRTLDDLINGSNCRMIIQIWSRMLSTRNNEIIGPNAISSKIKGCLNEADPMIDCVKDGVKVLKLPKLPGKGIQWMPLSITSA